MSESLKKSKKVTTNLNLNHLQLTSSGAVGTQRDTMTQLYNTAGILLASWLLLNIAGSEGEFYFLL